MNLGKGAYAGGLILSLLLFDCQLNFKWLLIVYVWPWFIQEEEAAASEWKGEFSVDDKDNLEEVQDGNQELLADFVEYIKVIFFAVPMRLSLSLIFNNCIEAAYLILWVIITNESCLLIFNYYYCHFLFLVYFTLILLLLPSDIDM